MGRKLTLRGTMIPTTGPTVLKQLFDFEGDDLTRAWKIISAQCMSIAEPSKGSSGLVLHTDESSKVLPLVHGFDDNQIIGYTGGIGFNVEIIDPNHIIVNQLYGTGLAALTYIIVIEEMKIDPTENTIYQLKERAQGPLL